MHRNFYFFGIFFLGLYVTAALFQSIIYFQLGNATFTLQSFADWFVLGIIIYLLGSLFILKYYHCKKYWFAFSAGTIATIVSLFLFTIFYRLLVARELESLYIPTLFLSLGAGIVYAISLIFSKAGKRPWLKAAGVFTFIIGLVTVSVLIWGLNSPNIQINGTLEKINQWISLANSLVPVLFIMNFLSEIRTLKAENATTTQHKYTESLLGLVGIITLVLTLFLGQKIASESNRLLAWNNRGLERAQRLAEPFEARTYVNSVGDTMRYRLLKPLDYDPQKKYPLVVCLHGGGVRGTDNIRQIEGCGPAQVLSKQYNREKYPAFLFVPQCPPDAIWGGVPNYPAVDSLVFETIYALEKEFLIDEKRRYVAGGSMGGYGSWHFICTHPEMFAAAIPISGVGDPDLAPYITDVSVWAFHGRQDRSVPVSGSRDIIEAIKRAGGNPRYKEYPDEGHGIWYIVFQTPGILDWLFAQQRD